MHISTHIYTVPKTYLDTCNTDIVEQIQQPQENISYTFNPLFDSIESLLYCTSRTIYLSKTLTGYLKFVGNSLIFSTKDLFRTFLLFSF